jgi:uncharacterized protein YukE
MSQIMYNYPAMLAHAADMAGTHENNTTSMLARDQAEGAKWGG